MGFKGFSDEYVEAWIENEISDLTSDRDRLAAELAGQLAVSEARAEVLGKLIRRPEVRVGQWVRNCARRLAAPFKYTGKDQ